MTLLLKKITLAAVMSAAFMGAACAQTITDNFKGPAMAAMKGQQIDYLPISLGFDMAEAWGAGVKAVADANGMKLHMEDPNWNTGEMAQALESMIAEHPAVIVTQNPDFNSLAHLLKKANKEGIYVIQVNMQGAYQSDAFVGPDFESIGEKEANIIVNACGAGTNTSHEVAINQGVITGGVSVFQINGVMAVLKKHPDIKIVAEQAANWNASQDRSITATELQQYPHLCGIIDVWDGQAIGAAAAVQQAGMQGKVVFVTSGGGAESMCNSVADGSYTYAIDYHADDMGRAVGTMIEALLQSKLHAGTIKTQIYVPWEVLTKQDIRPGLCWSAAAYAKYLKG